VHVNIRIVSYHETQHRNTENKEKRTNNLHTKTNHNGEKSGSEETVLL